MKVAPHRRGGISFARLIPLILGITLMPSMMPAGVVRVEITSREVVSDAAEHGRYGPYEVIKGIIYLEVDPDEAANALIADLKLAERNERGMVEFSTDFELHKPVNAELGNRRLLYGVNNRGNKFAEYHFRAGAGKNWLRSQGWSYVWCGWNCDVIPSEHKLNINVPVATESGETITGKIYCEMISYEDTVVYSHPLVWGGSIAYLPASMDDPTAVLTMREYRWEDPVAVPREGWSFARMEDGQVVADPGQLYIKDGFKPGWLYDLVYTGKDPKVTGLGMAAIRDVVAFFRYEAADEAGLANPLAGMVEHTYAWGHSQSARLLNHFVYQNFNGDEQGRIVFDGVIGNCGGGGKGQFNSRFAQMTRHGSHHEDNLYPIDFFPFTTVEQYDPITGERGDGIGMGRASGTNPKIFYINSSTDYWTRAASLLHTDVEGKTDAAIDPEVRIYSVAGRAHVDDRIGILGRALLTAMDQWVSEGVEPPESQIPRISDGTLVDLDTWKKAFPDIPGVGTPPSYYQPYRLDPGSRWDSEGIADHVPPTTGLRYVALVPQVDRDGTEIAGIKLPEIAVPLATFTGWNLRPAWYSRTIGRNTGVIWSLARTKKERKRNGDPRKSIAERYRPKEEYLSQVTVCLAELKQQRFLLDEDHDILLKQARLQAEMIHDLRSPEEVALESAEADMAYTEKVINADLLWWFGMSVWEFASRIRARGFEYLAADQLEKAIEVLELNTRLVPHRWETWDGLAEYYYTLKDYKLAKQYYERSLKAWSGNEHTKNMLERIAEEQKRE